MSNEIVLELDHDPVNVTTVDAIEDASETSTEPAFTVDDLIDFDDEWYTKTYAKDIARYIEEGESTRDFYIRFGGRFGHDPNADFSELLYRNLHKDVYSAILIYDGFFGYVHYLKYGMAEARQIADRVDASSLRALIAALDPDYIQQTTPYNTSKYPSPYDFYLFNVKIRKLSPHQWFSEEAYLEFNEDIKLSVDRGELVSGFHHYVKTSKHECRRYLSTEEYRTLKRKEAEKEARQLELRNTEYALEVNMKDLTKPQAIEHVKYMEFFLDDIDVTVLNDKTNTIYALVPNYLPEILFGGYMAFFDLIQYLKAAVEVRIVLVVVNMGSEDVHRWNCARMKAQKPKIDRLFDEVIKFEDDRSITISQNSTIISYSCELHFIAKQMADAVNKKPLFFIQEYEPDFHSNNDWYYFIKNTYQIPHDGIFNSQVLFNYFKTKTDIVKNQGPDYWYTTFENALEATDVQKIMNYRQTVLRRKHRLIFYGRPEGHAGRNCFGVFVVALKKAIRQGLLPPNKWEFIGVGSLTTEVRLDLADGAYLDIRTKLDFEEYQELLSTGDIGVSFISTPHPGIIHFQMAKYGLVTITNTTAERTATWLEGQNKNIVPVELSVEAIISGLKIASERAQNVEQRMKYALEVKTETREEALRGAIQDIKQRHLEH